MQLTPGTRIGPYEIAAPLGAGGMGEVYRAHDERLARDVAVKLLPEAASGDAGKMRRMLQEARAAGQLSHPNILAVFDVGTHEGRTYVVTELLSGESLREVVRRGPLPWRKALALAAQIAEGLAAAHDRGIVHRDVKPDNVFLTRDDRIKILDFGVATWRAPDGAVPTAEAATVSQGGLLVGTVGYMSPEQARGQPVDARTDLFAFGCLLHELLSGREAFGGATPMEVLVAIQRDAPAPLQDLVPGLPADVARLVERCLEKDPARRFQSARDLLFTLTLLPTTITPDRGAPAPAAPSPTAPPSPDAPRPPDTPRPPSTLLAPSPAGPSPAVARPDNASRLRAALPVVLALLAGAAVTAAAQRALFPAPELPVFRQITFRRGTVYTARFTLDGAGVVYSAAWEGKPRELFATVPGTGDVRSLDQPETDVALFLSSGEIGVLRRTSRGFSPGVLARMSLAGGPPKDLLAGVSWADGSPDGARFVVARTERGRSILEYPAGHPLLETPRLSYPRLSPDGTRIAFLEHVDPEEDSGRLVVVDRTGKRTLETETWKSIEGLAWRSDREIWFTASREGRSLWLHAVDLAGKRRILCRVPGRLVLHDLAPDGRVVAERNSYRATLMLGTSGPAGAASTPEREISWQDFSQLAQLSQDGTQVLFSEQGDGAGTGITAYLRPVQGGAPLRLGDGFALALSPDASRALLRSSDGGLHLDVVPIGAGRAERLPPGPLASISWARFLPGSARIVLLGKEPGKPDRLYLQDLGGGDPRPVGPDAADVIDDALSPDGTLVAGAISGKPSLIPLDGSAPRELPGLADHLPIGWTSDGRTLFVRAKPQLPIPLSRYDLATAALTPWRTLSPLDPAGVLGLDRVSLARDGEVYVYESYRLLSDLYVIENLR